MHLSFYRLTSFLKTLLFLFSLAFFPVHTQDLAAEGANGDASAQFLLGVMYLDGTRVTRDFKMAETWFLRAANQGNMWAQYKLAALYADGRALQRDYRKAFYWGKILADKGHRLSQFGISILYENGRGADKDPVQARRWLDSAVALGSPGAIAHMEALDSAAQARALSDPVRWPELLKKADVQNDALTQYWIGHAYLTGHGLKKDTDQAWVWLGRAAQQGNAFAQYDLSFLYPIGEGIRPEFQPAVQWLLMAASSWHVKALFNLGGLYEKGNGVIQNWNEAYRLYILAAGAGNANAIVRLRAMESVCRIPIPTHPQCETFQPEIVAAFSDPGSLYRLALTIMDGDGITQSYGQSIRWFRLAANQGHVQSQYLMGEIFRNGLGVDRDKRMARFWYRVAAQNGHADAIRHIQTGR